MITPAQHEAIANAALVYGAASRKQLVELSSDAKRQAELDRAADKAWFAFLDALAAVTDWSADAQAVSK